MERMNKLTALGGTAWGFGRVPEGGGIAEANRQRQFIRVRDPGGERRRLFGVSEGPAEAVAVAKQDAWNGATQAGVRNRMRNNDLRLRYGHRHKSLSDGCSLKMLF